MPTAGQVAAAIVAAARAQRVHPEEVVGARPTKMTVAAARARAYAAMAIDRVFNTSRPKVRHRGYPLSRVAIARMVGAPKASQDGLVNGIERKLSAKHDVAWWCAEDFERVVAAVGRAIASAPTVPPPRRDAVTSLAPRRIDAEATERRPQPPAAPAPRAPSRALPESCPGVALTVKGDIRVEPRGWKISLREKTAELRDTDAFRVVALLSKVSPALLVTEDMAARLWPSDRDGASRIRMAVRRANDALEPVGLKIREMPKFGFSISEA